MDVKGSQDSRAKDTSKIQLNCANNYCAFIIADSDDTSRITDYEFKMLIYHLTHSTAR